MKRIYKNRVRWLGLFTRNLGHYCENSGKFKTYNNFSTIFYDTRIEITKVKESYFRTIFSRPGISRVYIEYRNGEISEWMIGKSSIQVLGDIIKVLRTRDGR